LSSANQIPTTTSNNALIATFTSVYGFLPAQTETHRRQFRSAKVPSTRKILKAFTGRAGGYASRGEPHIDNPTRQPDLPPLCTPLFNDQAQL
jgi:hypothetical protein